jgi:hypothetical protein
MGYRKWFHSRMTAVFEERKKALQKGIRAGTEPIPDYRIRTPLQSSIMILKRHRDIMFVKRSDERPISIILTTLAAHAYNGERKISDALFAILNRMDQYIKRGHDGTYLIPNPTDPAENFADKWAKHPERAAAFFEWIAKAERTLRVRPSCPTRNSSPKTLRRAWARAWPIAPRSGPFAASPPRPFCRKG